MSQTAVNPDFKRWLVRGYQREIAQAARHVEALMGAPAMRGRGYRKLKAHLRNHAQRVSEGAFDCARRLAAAKALETVA